MLLRIPSHWLMQPTLVPSKEFVQVPLRLAVVVLAPPHVAENERVSLALAKQENAKLGTDAGGNGGCPRAQT